MTLGKKLKCAFFFLVQPLIKEIKKRKKNQPKYNQCEKCIIFNINRLISFTYYRCIHTCIFTLNLDWVRNTIYVCPNGAINCFVFLRNSLDFFSIKTFIQPSKKKLKQAHKWICKDKFNLKTKHWILNVNLAMTCFFFNIWYSRSRKISLLQCITCILKYQSLTCT